MTVVTTRITVSPEGAIAVAAALPACEYIARIETRDPSAAQLPISAIDVGARPVRDLGA